MDMIDFHRADWEVLEGKWQELVIESYHSTYNGMGEYYNAIVTPEEKIVNIKHYISGLPVWAAWTDDQLAGLLMGRIDGHRLVLYDLFVSPSFRRQGIGRQLIQLAIQESGAREISAEVNRDNDASQELFRSLKFQREHTSDWLVLRISSE